MFCPICKYTVSNNIISYNDQGWNSSKTFEGLKLKYCEQCGFGFVDPVLSNEEVNNYYSQIYRAKNSPFYFNFNVNEDIRLSKSYQYGDERSFSQLVLARSFVNFNNNDIFLDIGPGKGGSFTMAKLILPSPKLFAIELTDGASKFLAKSLML